MPRNSEALTEALEGFQGLPLERVSKTGFATFRFGRWVTRQTRSGRTVEDTTHTLLVETAWRVVKGGRFCNWGSSTDETYPNREGRLWHALLTRMGRKDLRFGKWQLGPSGELSVELGRGYRLQIVPLTDQSSFHWAVHVPDENIALYCVGPSGRIEDWT